MPAVPRARCRAGCALVVGAVLSAALACTIMWLAALTAPMPAMDGMARMSGMSGMSGVAVTTGMDHAETPAAHAAATEPTATDANDSMSMWCDSVCLGAVTDVCAAGLGLAVVSVLMLLLGSRRDTFLGLVGRAGPVRPRRRPRRTRDPWTVLSLSSLGVLRV